MKNKYNTKQREKILKYLQDNKEENVTADEIINYFKTSNEQLGKATVYRNLNYLVDENIVKKYVLEERNCSSYQYIDGKNCNEHYHLKCSKCHKIIHLECEEFKQIQNHILKEHDFELDGNKTVLYGMCKDCKISIKETERGKSLI